VPFDLTKNLNKTLRCSDLKMRFDGVTALDNVTVEFPNSGVVAIIGPNGAGKTTFINALTGFVELDAGQCYFGDRKITGLAPHKVARLGIVRTFQDLRLMQQGSLLDNVLLARPRQRGERLIAALCGIGLQQEENRNVKAAIELLQFVGLADKEAELASNLSYGQQKLLTLACCLATEAVVLFLDEPVAGIHPEMTTRILSLLRRLGQEGRLVVFIEHNIDAVRQIADRVIVLDQGLVIADGIPKEVLDRQEIIEAYLG
jgi:branched-chain amino acid transport system ATP-binding protein